MDRFSKIRAGWRIATAGSSLTAKMRLVTYLYAKYTIAKNDLDKELKNSSELDVLKAWDQVIQENIHES